MHPRQRSFAILLALFLVLALGASSCGGAYGPRAAEMAGAAPAPPEAEPKPSAQVAGDAETWKRSELRAHEVRLMVGDREEIPVRSMQARVTIDGGVARVVLDLLARNDLGGTYEGRLQLRLPEGASPFFFAFGEATLMVAGDAPPPAFFSADQARSLGAEPAQIISDRASQWRGVKEARMVPKEKAAFAYGETVRRGVDPALVEWAGPSIFNARVFPLTSGVSHRIVVGYDVPLVRIGEDLQYTFDLPEKVGHKVVDLAVAAPAGAAVETTPPSPGAPVAGRSHHRFESPAGPEIAVRIRRPAPAYLAATDPETGAYFAADVAPDLPVTAVPPGPGAALFLVDTSLSSNPDRFNIWLKLLETILRSNRDTIQQYNVLFFNIEQSFFKPTFVENNDATLAELRAHAGGLALEGATDLAAALAQAAAPPGAGQPGAPPRWEVFLLSDGAATWGEADPFVMSRRLASSRVGAVYAYQTGLAGTDTDTLSLLARETGGAVFSVTGDAEVQAAATAHRARPLRIVEAKVPGGRDLLIAGRPRFVYPGQRLRVVGRGAPDAGAALELTLAEGGSTRVVRAPLGQAIPSPLAVRAYGQVAVGQIEELLPANEGPARAYASHFRVPGKTCSLLMLESEADYQRFNIRPEDDASVVQAREASRLVEDALAELAGSLGDPKRAFLRWLDRLPEAAGVPLQFPPGFREALNRIPAASFGVRTAPLAVKRRDRAAVPAGVQRVLAKHDVDHDLLSAEAERRRLTAGPGDALKALSSLVEENPGDAVLARDVGTQAMTWGLPGDAYHLFRRVASSRPHEPQTYRGLAQSLARLGMADLALAYFEVGLAGQWDARFGEFRRILAVEYLELLRRVLSGKARSSIPEYARSRWTPVAQMVGLGRADLVVMITWNTDATDVDLHVIEPDGEECYYAHNQTSNGGELTTDVTQGYGPEMYVMREADEGRYLVRAHYYAADRSRASTRTKVHAVVIEDYGTPHQRVGERVVTLEQGKDVHNIVQVVRGERKALVAR